MRVPLWYCFVPKMGWLSEPITISQNENYSDNFHVGLLSFGYLLITGLLIAA
jgi:hypothetical protein